MSLPEKLKKKLQVRKDNDSFRSLSSSHHKVDFSSNDYLGLSQDSKIFQRAHEYLIELKGEQNGATGSRLISGNHFLYDQVEKFLSEFHEAESALVFNSGYDANLGFFSSVPQRGDIILYDEYSHASIRDGIKMSNAKAYKFSHNNLNYLKELLVKYGDADAVYVVTESVFSMDGDSPDLEAMIGICQTHNALLVIDEAHAVGVMGFEGRGLVPSLNQCVFARIITFGKALGCHGAAILGASDLKDYLINFSRSFIYTTGLPPHSLATILLSYQEMIRSKNQKTLENNIYFFKKELQRLELLNRFIQSNSAIHSCLVSGNSEVKSLAKNLQNQGFDVKPILYPTVPLGEERIRFCLHAYNSYDEITKVLTSLCIFVS